MSYILKNPELVTVCKGQHLDSHGRVLCISGPPTSVPHFSNKDSSGNKDTQREAELEEEALRIGGSISSILWSPAEPRMDGTAAHHPSVTAE